MNIKFLYRYILILIFILAFILRFWHYPYRYGIGYDGSRDAIVSFEAAKQKQLPLTGSFSSIGPITFGPWYYYYLTFSNYLIPVKWAPWVAVSLTSILMILIMFEIGTKIKSRKLGLFLAFLTSFSPAQVTGSTLLQQHALISFFSSLFLLIYLILNKKRSVMLSLLWGFITGVAINTHFQAIGLTSLPFLFFIYKKDLKSLIYFLTGIFFSMLPLLFFELNNHWFNTRNIIDYLLIGQYRIWTSNRWLTFLGKFWPEFWSWVIGTPITISFIVMIFVCIYLIHQFFSKKLKTPLTIITISFVIQVVILRYYRGEKFFGYLQFFHSYIFLYTGLILLSLNKFIKNKILLFLLVLIFINLIHRQTFRIKPFDYLNYETWQRINFLKNKYPKQKFSTYECGKVYDVDRIQALTLLLYIHRLYEDNGLKTGIFNPACNVEQFNISENQLVNLENLDESIITASGYKPITPVNIYNGTARWWFAEQP